MSQIEQRLESLLARRPEIEKCYQAGLLNRRALARFLVAIGAAGPEQLDAVVAAIRRHDFREPDAGAQDLFPDLRISVKDRILILDFEKEKGLLRRLERVIGQIDYDRGDTLKVVVGTASIKLFIDRKKAGALRFLVEEFRLRARHDSVNEISLSFPDAASSTRGVLSVLTRELALHDIVITELLTASPELLLYVKDEYVTRTFDVLRTLQQAPPTERAPASGHGRRPARAPRSRRTRVSP